MKKRNRAQSIAKRTIKRSLITSKKILARSRTAKKAGRYLRDEIFQKPSQNIYDYSRYAPTIADYQKQLKQQESFKHRPLISIVMPTYNTTIQFLEECIESVLIQSYTNWELCIADDASPDGEVVKTIKKFVKQDSRIKLIERKVNGHISEATNSAIEIASGDYIALLDHDDVLWPNALFEVVKVINDDPSTDFIYTDEDKIDKSSKIHSYPFFKPDWSPEFLESCNYITHFSCIRAGIVNKIGGFRKGYEGAQDWDLFLRIADITSNITHIPKVLYSWRIHEASTASNTDAKPYVYEAQRKLLADHLKRNERLGKVKQGIIKQHSCIQYEVKGSPKIAIIVSAKGKDLLKYCLKSIKAQSYNNVEYIVVTKSEKESAIAKRILGSGKSLTIIHSAENNYCEGINKAVKNTNAEYVVLIDGGMAVSGANWIEVLLGDAQQPGIGVVGGKTISLDRDRFLRAGVGAGIYGTYASLLEWMPVDDVHYMRGLYGQSRRNAIAVDGGCVMVSRKAFEDVGGISETMNSMAVVDLCLKMLDAGRRNVYNPFVTTTDPQNLTAGELDKLRNGDEIRKFKVKWATFIENDPYLNPNFTRTNAQLDIK